MVDIAFYLVTKDIAQRAGLVGVRYIAPDGRYILDNKDLSRIRFTTDEYIEGLKGVEKISEKEAATLIRKGGSKMTKASNSNETNKEKEKEE